MVCLYKIVIQGALFAAFCVNLLLVIFGAQSDPHSDGWAHGLTWATRSLGLSASFSIWFASFVEINQWLRDKLCKRMASSTTLMAFYSPILLFMWSLVTGPSTWDALNSVNTKDCDGLIDSDVNKCHLAQGVIVLTALTIIFWLICGLLAAFGSVCIQNGGCPRSQKVIDVEDTTT